MSDPHQGGPGAGAPYAGGAVAETLDMSPSPPTTTPGTASPPTPPPNTAPMPQNMRPATQMSASAVPSTLESPTDKAAGGDIEGTTEKTGRPIIVDEILGPAVVGDSTVRDDQLRVDVLREVARREAAHDTGRQAPMTLMSPLVAEVQPVDPNVHAVPLPPAVTFAQPPPHAYYPPTPAPVPSYPSHAASGHMQMGPRQGMPHNPIPRRSSNTLIIVSAAVAAVLLLLAVVAGFGAFVLRSRQRADDTASPTPPRAAPGAPKPPSRGTPFERR